MRSRLEYKGIKKHSKEGAGTRCIIAKVFSTLMWHPIESIQLDALISRSYKNVSNHCVARVNPLPASHFTTKGLVIDVLLLDFKQGGSEAWHQQSWPGDYQIRVPAMASCSFLGLWEAPSHHHKVQECLVQRWTSIPNTLHLYPAEHKIYIPHQVHMNARLAIIWWSKKLFLDNTRNIQMHQQSTHCSWYKPRFWSHSHCRVFVQSCLRILMASVLTGSNNQHKHVSVTHRWRLTTASGQISTLRTMDPLISNVL